MTDQSAAEAKQQAIDAIGKDLGAQYAEFWQELAQLNITWSEFMELYGTKKSRIELMNRSPAISSGWCRTRYGKA